MQHELRERRQVKRTFPLPQRDEALASQIAGARRDRVRQANRTSEKHAQEALDRLVEATVQVEASNPGRQARAARCSTSWRSTTSAR